MKAPYSYRAPALRFAAILFAAVLMGGSLAARTGEREDDQDRTTNHPTDWRRHVQARLTALAAGIRFLPDPGERSYLNDPADPPPGLEFPAPEEEPAKGATAAGAETNPPEKRQDRVQSFGLLIRAGERPESREHAGFYYRAELGFFFQEGGGGFSREDRDARGAGDTAYGNESANESEESSADPLAFYPGNDLFVAFRANGGLDLALGRKSTEAWRDHLSGGHGPLTGLHLGLENEYALLTLSPYHRHSLAGNYMPDGGDPAQLHRMGLRQSEDLRSVARGSESYGQSAALIGRLGMFRLGLNYAANRQEETARLAGSSRAIDRIEYAGGGLGLGREKPNASWEVYLHMERSVGFTRALRKDLDGNRTLRIDGRALRAGAAYRGESFSFALRLFLPEPATLPGTGNAGRSGYVSYGDSPPSTPLLAGALDSRPAPLLCRDRRRCEGIEINTDQPGFAAHAGVAELSLGWQGERILLGLDAAVLRPVAARAAAPSLPGSEPSKRIRPDENASAYGEIALTAGWRFPRGRLRLQYARLVQQRERTGASRLAGEALYLTMEYDL